MMNMGLEVTYRVDPAGLSDAFVANLNFQLLRLKLNERYPTQINTFLFGQRTGILQFVDTNPDPAALKNFLELSARNLEQDFGRNDWRAALFSGLAACDAFCNGGMRDYFAHRHAQPLPDAV
jgi:hypothetical protein